MGGVGEHGDDKIALLGHRLGLSAALAPAATTSSTAAFTMS
jgi:hypothetical protein